MSTALMAADRPLITGGQTTVTFAEVEIRNFLSGAETIFTQPHPLVRLESGLTPSYMHRDHLNSVHLVTSETGAIADRRTYKPFGEMRSWTDPAHVQDAKGWIGERYDAGADLQYLNARYYDPQLGLFLQPDWFEVTEPGVGTNRYAYSANDPINAKDPGGNNFFDAIRDLFRSDEKVIGDASSRIDDAYKHIDDANRDFAEGKIDEETRDFRVSEWESQIEYNFERVKRRASKAKQRLNALLEATNLALSATPGAGQTLGKATLQQSRTVALDAAAISASRQQVRSDLKSLRSLAREINEHIDKVDAIRSNPTLPPGMIKAMENGKVFTEAQKQMAVARRIAKLQREIRAFQKGFDDILSRLR